MIHYPLLTPQRELAIMHKAGGLPLAPGVFAGTAGRSVWLSQYLHL